MLAKRIPGILPPLTREESIELTKIYSILGRVSSEQPLREERPFRKFIILHPNRRCLVEDRRLFREKSVWRTRVFCF